MVLLILLGIVAILWIAKWAIVIYALTASIFSGGLKDYSDWRCPHGYDSFGCQPECPLYEHCWGPRDK